MLRLHLTALALICLVATARSSQADTWDINVARLCQIQTQSGVRLACGGGYNPSDPVVQVIKDNAAFRSLMSELGVVFAPNILSPSDTRGYGGFSLATEFGWTMVNPHRNATDPVMKVSHRYWRAANSVSAQAFESGNIHTDAAVSRIEQELPPSFAPTVTIMARKGLWIPLPSTELGVGVRHLIGSRMWAPQVTAKIALHEGFHGWPIPSLAVRGTGARLLGTSGFNVTLAGLDFSISKHLGVASTFNLSPYMGYQLLWIIADSEVLDATPGVDAINETRSRVGDDPLKLNQCQTTDCRGYFTFANQSNITRHRFFVGIKANFSIASLLLEYSFFASGSASDQLAAGTGLLPPVLIQDESGAQHNISFSIALDY